MNDCFHHPLDRVLHAAGCCRCASAALIAQTHPPLTPTKADALLNCFGFHLESFPNGTFVACAPLRGLQCPSGASLGTAPTAADLRSLIVRARSPQVNGSS